MPFEVVFAPSGLLQALETRYSYADVVFFRSLVAAEVKLKLGGGRVTLRQPKPGFFSRLFGSSDAPSVDVALSPEELKVAVYTVDS